ncbi:class I SAM-dependent methyltransferase [Tardiphaga sp. 862_B3_N4_1]|uniref:class I SAM-dependent methyltransferase n=1 Tax=unclassified Tardiphaga TaxID=2631404 RepID=UPI0008A737BD|nr:class I SAM-dependent methyltransferase [Tardiphaga sp. OK245]SEH99039.1 hypothetical protein SAMN05216367_2747 [Tardiphaga sp. OK245]
MNSPRGLASRSLETSDGGTYEAVASEYYDECAHPTCADFRAASALYLTRLFDLELPTGRVADIGCGRSLLVDFNVRDLVLVDKSRGMLLHNSTSYEQRALDVERQEFGEREFDWIFAILGDPYNSPSAWGNIARALKAGAQCVFIVPALQWAQKFRSVEDKERVGFARFLTLNGDTVFLPSLIVDLDSQIEMISAVGLSLDAVDHVSVGQLPAIKSDKISGVLMESDHLLDVYRVRKIIAP